jgi:hypothetical protein
MLEFLNVRETLMFPLAHELDAAVLPIQSILIWNEEEFGGWNLEVEVEPCFALFRIDQSFNMMKCRDVEFLHRSRAGRRMGDWSQGGSKTSKCLREA